MTGPIEAAIIRVIAATPRRWTVRFDIGSGGTVIAAALPPILPYEDWFAELRETSGDTFLEAATNLADLLDKRPIR